MSRVRIPFPALSRCYGTGSRGKRARASALLPLVSCPAAPHPTRRRGFVSEEDPGDVAKWLRRRSAKPLCIGSNPIVASQRTVSNAHLRWAFRLLPAGVAELVDAKDLKSFGPQGPCGFKSRLRYNVYVGTACPLAERVFLRCVSFCPFVY